MNNSFISLGTTPNLFIFERNTLMPSKLARSRSQKVSKHAQHGRRDILQNNGKGQHKLTLTGMIMPDQNRGTSKSLDDIYALEGEQALMIGGKPQGNWLIMSISETHDFIDKKANAKVIAFSIVLEKQGGANGIYDRQT